MASNARLFRDYINGLQTNLKLGNATEHTHRPVLKTLLESIGDRVTATNEPRRIECGAPDFVVTKTVQNQLTVGYVEAKDVGYDLEQIEGQQTKEPIDFQRAATKALQGFAAQPSTDKLHGVSLVCGRRTAD